MSSGVSSVVAYNRGLIYRQVSFIFQIFVTSVLWYLSSVYYSSSRHLSHLSSGTCPPSIIHLPDRCHVFATLYISSYLPPCGFDVPQFPEDGFLPRCQLYSLGTIFSSTVCQSDILWFPVLISLFHYDLYSDVISFSDINKLPDDTSLNGTPISHIALV